ncbi:MAG TPA: hypothetical protein VHQ65_14620 [Thermoanaerobaculia bacterium]|nr:hypothetical protein [Thermoanaerobaculia bacterium]
MDQHSGTGRGVDRRRFLQAGGALAAAGYLAPSVARAQVTPGLSPVGETPLGPKPAVDCIDVLITGLAGIPTSLKNDLWAQLGAAGIAISAEDGAGAIAALQQFVEIVETDDNLDILNATQGGFRDPAFPGAGGIGDGVLAAAEYLISLGPTGLLEREVVLTAGVRAAIDQCDRDLATCLGRPFQARVLCYGLLLIPAPLGVGLFAASVQVLDGALGNPPCYTAFRGCVASAASAGGL